MHNNGILNFPKKVLFRVDGNEHIGLGHIMRCQALADMLKHTFDCEFAIHEPSKNVKSLFENRYKVLGLEGEISGNMSSDGFLNYLSGFEVVVLDGYNFSNEYRQHISNKGCKVVCIDDMCENFLCADAIINHAPGISEKNYRTLPFTELYLGTRYALLRKEFLDMIGRKRNIESISTVFICFGGSDIKNLSQLALEAVLRIDDITVINLIIGGENPYKVELDNLIKLHGKGRVRLYSNLRSAEIVEIMLKSDLAITSASGICLELMTVGLGMILGNYAENQKMILNGCIEESCCYSVGDYRMHDQNSLEENIRSYIDSKDWHNHIENQKRIFKQNSDDNLERLFSDLFKERCLNSRAADEADINTYFDWVNDPAVRGSAINTEGISFDDHKRWFGSKISSETSYLYFFEFNTLPVGQVRFDKNNDEYVIDYSVDSQFRGMGVGRLLVKMALKQLADVLGGKVIVKAIVKASNIASQRVFERLGFHKPEFQALSNDYFTFKKEITL